MLKFSVIVNLSLFIVMLAVFACSADKKAKGVVEGYKPKQSIEFSHDIHVGKNGIDCRYCHNSQKTDSGKTTAELCGNCHKQIKGRSNQ